MNTARKFEVEDVASRKVMSEAQLHCVRHLLKEFGQILESTDSIIEYRSGDITPQELHSCLEGLSSRLNQCLDYLAKDSFCCIEPARCAFVSRYTGCQPLRDRDGV